MVRRVIQQLHRLANGIDELHHTVETLRSPATALRTVVHFDLDRLGVLSLLCLQGVPPRCEGIDHTVAGFVGTAKAQTELTTLFIHDATRNILLLATPGMITCLVLSSCQTATGALPDMHRGCTIHAQAFDTL